MAQLKSTSVTGNLSVTGNVVASNKIIQGTLNSDSSIAGMNQFNADLFVSGNGSAPNVPKIPGFYLGKSQTDENRHMDIVSGGGVSYIDFNSSTNQNDYMDRLYVNVADGSALWQWNSSATNKTFTFESGKIIANEIQYSLDNNLFSTDKYSYNKIAIIDNYGKIKHRLRDEFIKDLNLSVIFNLKGTVNATADLKTKVANVGDVYVVTTSPTSSYVCIKSSEGFLADAEFNTYWAEIGLTVDLQGYSPIGSLAVIHSTGTPGVNETYGTRYYPVYVDTLNEVITPSSTSYNTNYTNSLARANPDFYYFDSGTWSSLNVGQKDHCGILTLHYGTATTDRYADITPANNFTANRTFTLPNTGGSFVTVLNQQTGTYVPKFNADGYTITNSHITDDDAKINMSLPVSIIGDNSELLKVISDVTDSGKVAWKGRILSGIKSLTVLMGVYNNMAALGAHSWNSSGTSTWAPLYINPDGNQSVYIGGQNWTKDSGILNIDNGNISPVNSDDYRPGGIYANRTIYIRQWENSSTNDYNPGGVQLGRRGVINATHRSVAENGSTEENQFKTVFGINIEDDDDSNNKNNLYIGHNQFDTYMRGNTTMINGKLWLTANSRFEYNADDKCIDVKFN